MNTKTLAAFLLMSLSTGCIVVGNGNPPPPPPPPAVAGDVTFHWSFEGKDCAQTPDVAKVRVIIAGESLANGGLFPCLVSGYGGIVLHDFAPRTYSFTVQGLYDDDFVLYEESGTFTVNGHVEVAVNLDNILSYSFLSWRLPPTATHQNPTCAQAGVTWMDIWIDGIAEPRVYCQQGTGNSSVATAFLAPGQHQITLVALDDTLYPMYRFDGPLVIQQGAPGYSQYQLGWGVGGAALKWQLTNGATIQSCAQAGVNTVYVNFMGQDNEWVYPGAGDAVDCTFAWVSYDYLQPGTYRVFLQATGTAGAAYESNFNNMPSVTVQAGEWPGEQQALNVLISRL